jgi:hypothetical protein
MKKYLIIAAVVAVMSAFCERAGAMEEARETHRNLTAMLNTNIREAAAHVRHIVVEGGKDEQILGVAMFLAEIYGQVPDDLLLQEFPEELQTRLLDHLDRIMEGDNPDLRIPAAERLVMGLGFVINDQYRQQARRFLDDQERRHPQTPSDSVAYDSMAHGTMQPLMEEARGIHQNLLTLLNANIQEAENAVRAMIAEGRDAQIVGIAMFLAEIHKRAPTLDYARKVLLYHAVPDDLQFQVIDRLRRVMEGGHPDLQLYAAEYLADRLGFVTNDQYQRQAQQFLEDQGLRQPPPPLPPANSMAYDSMAHDSMNSMAHDSMNSMYGHDSMNSMAHDSMNSMAHDSMNSMAHDSMNSMGSPPPADSMAYDSMAHDSMDSMNSMYGHDSMNSMAHDSMNSMGSPPPADSMNSMGSPPPADSMNSMDSMK